MGHTTPAGRHPEDMRATFEMMDTDGSGSMDFKEFRDAMRMLEIGMSNERLAVLWRILDADHSGEIDVMEFLELVYRDDPYVLVELGVQGRRASILGSEESEEESEEDSPREPRAPRDPRSEKAAADLSGALDALGAIRRAQRGHREAVAADVGAIEGG